MWLTSICSGPKRPGAIYTRSIFRPKFKTEQARSDSHGIITGANEKLVSKDTILILTVHFELQFQRIAEMFEVIFVVSSIVPIIKDYLF